MTQAFVSAEVDEMPTYMVALAYVLEVTSHKNADRQLPSRSRAAAPLAQ
jgi:hypothetical protein